MEAHGEVVMDHHGESQKDTRKQAETRRDMQRERETERDGQRGRGAERQWLGMVNVRLSVIAEDGAVAPLRGEKFNYRSRGHKCTIAFTLNVKYIV